MARRRRKPCPDQLELPLREPASDPEAPRFDSSLLPEGWVAFRVVGWPSDEEPDLSGAAAEVDEVDNGGPQT